MITRDAVVPPLVLPYTALLLVDQYLINSMKFMGLNTYE